MESIPVDTPYTALDTFVVFIIRILHTDCIHILHRKGSNHEIRDLRQTPSSKTRPSGSIMNGVTTTGRVLRTFILNIRTVCHKLPLLVVAGGQNFNFLFLLYIYNFDAFHKDCGSPGVCLFFT